MEKLIDNDGNIYPTAKIGDYTWTTLDWKSSKYMNGTAITNFQNTEYWSSTIIPAYCTMPGYQMKYYNHFVTTATGFCPTGWHVSTTDEWLNLKAFILSKHQEPDTEGKYIRSTSILPGSVTSENAYCFFGKFNSYRAYNQGVSTMFDNFLKNAFWWASPYGTGNTDPAWHFEIRYNSPQLYRATDSKNNGYSIRLVKDHL